MATIPVGNIGEFVPDKEEWSQYETRLRYFFVANNIKEEAAQKAVFLTVVGPATFKTLTSLVSPASVDDKTYPQLTGELGKYYNPKPSEIVQRFKFNSRCRQPTESVATFVTELRALVKHCNYAADSLDSLLRDRLVCGINDMQMQRRLLSEDKLTFETAFKITLAMETAARDTQTCSALQQEQPQVKEENLKLQKIMPAPVRTPSPSSGPRSQCYRCGYGGHSSDSCKFRYTKCHNCGKTGHIVRVCRSKRPLQPQQHPPVSNQYLEETNPDLQDNGNTSAPPEYTMFSLEADQYTHPYVLELQLDEKIVRMEVDTGASLSLMPLSTFRKLWPQRELLPSNVKMSTYTGEVLAVSGTADVLVTGHGTETATLPLLIVEKEGPCLLGRNWLKSLRLDWRQLIRVHHLQDNPALTEVLQRHPHVFDEGLGTLRGFKAKICVDPSATPRFCKARPVPYAMRAMVEKELDRLVQQEILEPVQFADWAAPIVPVLKSDKKSLRICGDFKMTVNSASKLDAYPIPRIEDLFARLSGGVCFSKLDLSQAYLQLELEEDSKQFVVINTHKGLFRYNRLPFGISSAPGIFQRTMESLLQNIPSVIVYLDDILIAGQSEEEHLRLLEEVLSRLETAGLRLKREKCVLMSESVEYLGHTIDRHGLHPTKEKVKAVCEAPSPKNVSELKSYLGLLTYYSKFLPNLATLLAPLYQLLQSGVQWKWSAEQDKAFKASKELLVSSQVLVHFDSELPLVVACDASPYGLGAVLSHKYANGSERPIGYASRSLSSAERNYSQLEREGLACVFGVKRFHSYLYGHSFSLITDHKPLEGLFHEDRAIPAQASSRIQRWALTLAMYDYHLIHKKGSEHANADAFSRLPLPVTLDTTPQPPEVVLLMEQMRDSPVNTDHIRTWTRRDTTLSQVVQFVRYGWPMHLNDSSLQSYWQKRTELSLQEECLLWGNRVVIPQIGQERVLQELHEAHPGATRMKQLARTLVWWPGIDQDIEKAVKACPECQFHLSSPAEAPLLPWTWPSRPWSRVHIDFMGPFQGHMVLVLVDAHSKWIEAHVMSAITSTLTIQCLRRIFATFGLPEVIVTDNGPSLVSEEFEAWLKRNGIRHKTSPPYHPATNGLAERAVQTVKRGVKKMKSGTLSDKIARFLFAYRNTPHSTTGVSPAELLMGRKLRSPLDLLKPDLHFRVEGRQEKQKQYHDKSSRQRSFAIGDLVFVNNFSRSSADLWLPGQVIVATGPRAFQVKIFDGRIVRRHVDHMRIRTAPVAQKELGELQGFDFEFPKGPVDQPDPDTPPSTPVSPRTRPPRTLPPPRNPSTRVRRQPDYFAPLVSHYFKGERV